MQPLLANILQPLIDVFEPVLVFFHDTVGFGWGFSIVALTLTIRLILLPLTLKQVRSMRGLQEIAPQMKELQKKYKDDKQRLNQEMLALYRENKVNPAASCLPILAQLPVFIALFYLLRDDLRYEVCRPDQPPPPADSVPCGDTDASSFLFIPDITDVAPTGILIVLVVLYVGTQLASSLLMAQNADKNQKLLFLALPFLIIPFSITFPAGLFVYWITTNLWTIVQQFIVRRSVGPAPVPAVAVAAAGGPGNPSARKEQADGDGGGARARGAARTPKAKAGSDGNGAAAAFGANGADGARRRGATPPPPPRRKKKQRSGRRR